MKQQLFQKNRIRGVSFHRTGAAVPRSKPAVDSVQQQALQLTSHELSRGHPQPLTQRHIARLMFDIQRHELHAMVGECIEHLSRWKQLSQALDNYLTSGSRFLDLDESLDSQGGSRSESQMLAEVDQVNIAVEVRSIFLLWKHRLAILEFIAQAHPFLGYENLLKTKRRGGDDERRATSVSR